MNAEQMAALSSLCVQSDKLSQPEKARALKCVRNAVARLGIQQSRRNAPLGLNTTDGCWWPIEIYGADGAVKHRLFHCEIKEAGYDEEFVMSWVQSRMVSTIL